MERITKEELMMGFARLITERSTCSRLKVGSIIVDSKLKRIKGYGYNGNYAGGPNKCDNDEEGNCGCVHSEINALVNARGRDEDDIMFITDSPCLNCAKAIINAGIKKVYYHNEYRRTEGKNLLIKYGIKVKKI